MEINLIYSFSLKDFHNKGYLPFSILRCIFYFSKVFNFISKNEKPFYMTNFLIN